MSKTIYLSDIEKITLRVKATSRGGGIEIKLDPFGYPNRSMTAYQNYLGGGMLGRVDGDCNVQDWRNDNVLVEINEELKQYFHNLTNPDGDEWESMSYEQNQKLQCSAY